jgi:hypothetical protein
MKIAIIGRGTSAIITCLVLLQNNHDVTIFYDPENPYINVGESTTPGIWELVYDVLKIDIHEMVDKNIFSYKMGINFVNWGCGKTFHHNFLTKTAHHFETKIFNDFIHNELSERKLVNYIPQKVISITPEDFGVKLDEYFFDFVINCSGWEDEENYLDVIFKTVDSAVTFVDNLDYDPVHTLHMATEDGWQFGLPFPKQNIFKCGYLYNSDYITHDEVKNKINKDIRSSFTWKPRYAKELITHKRIALNGNRLFFLEPLQALSLYYTHYCAILISNYLNQLNDLSRIDLNHKYLYQMYVYQVSLAYHYQFGSIYNTKFWETTKDKALQFMKHTFNGNIEVFKKNLSYDLHKHNLNHGNLTYSKIGCFDILDHKQLYCGMTGEKIDKYI